MAEKRMFSNRITQSDPFLDMPASAQNLYFHLNMNADDDGFVNRTKSIMRMIGARDDDLKLLVGKHFIIPFEVEGKDGIMNVVVVVKHWFIHNKIRIDRKKETTYTQQKNMLAQAENGAYTLLNSEYAQICNQESTNGLPRLVEVRLGEDSIDKYVHEQNYEDHIAHEDEQRSKMFEQFWDIYPIKINKKRAFQNFTANVLNYEILNTILEDIPKRLKTSQWSSKQYIPHPTNYLKNRGWLDELIQSTPKAVSIAVQPVYKEFDESEILTTEEREAFVMKLKEGPENG